MSSRSILLIGAGGHAAACIDVIEAEGRFTIMGLVGSEPEVGDRVLGYQVLGTDAHLPELLARGAAALVAVGHIRTPEPRIRLFETLQRLRCELPSIVSPLAYVSRHATLGAGTIVLHGGIVNAGAAVGVNCIINSAALVEHDAEIGDHCHISTAAVINGGARIGSGTFVGSNATVRENVSVGERCVIGMSEQVRVDIKAGTIRSAGARRR